MPEGGIWYPFPEWSDLPRVKERLADGMVDELLAGARIEGIVGAGGLLSQLTKRLWSEST